MVVNSSVNRCSVYVCVFGKKGGGGGGVACETIVCVRVCTCMSFKR